MSHKIDDPFWDAGYNSYWDGLARDKNPYEADDPRHERWEQGWDTADSDDDT